MTEKAKVGMTPAEAEAYYEGLDKEGPGELSPDEAAAMRGLCTEDGSAAKPLDGCSGRLVIRIPKSLHRKLRDEAAAEGVSLNQYALWKLSVDVRPDTEYIKK